MTALTGAGDSSILPQGEHSTASMMSPDDSDDDDDTNQANNGGIIARLTSLKMHLPSPFASKKEDEADIHAVSDLHTVESTI